MGNRISRRPKRWEDWLPYVKRQRALAGIIGPIRPDDRQVLAEVNHGRWIAHCECGGAEWVDPDEPLFVCCSCDGGIRPVTFPKDAVKVEEELAQRSVEAQNWQRGETVKDLARENKERGL